MYSRAVEIDPVAALYNAQIYCNRAAARMKLAMHVEAAEDCNLAIAADDKYVKEKKAAEYINTQSFTSIHTFTHTLSPLFFAGTAV